MKHKINEPQLLPNRESGQSSHHMNINHNPIPTQHHHNTGLSAVAPSTSIASRSDWSEVQMTRRTLMCAVFRELLLSEPTISSSLFLQIIDVSMTPTWLWTIISRLIHRTLIVTGFSGVGASRRNHILILIGFGFATRASSAGTWRRICITAFTCFVTILTEDIRTIVALVSGGTGSIQIIFIDGPTLRRCDGISRESPEPTAKTLCGQQAKRDCEVFVTNQKHSSMNSLTYLNIRNNLSIPW